jgi:hypothetical protein
MESGDINREDFCDVAAFAQRLGLMPDPPRRAPHSRLAGPVETRKIWRAARIFCDRASTVSNGQLLTCRALGMTIY